MTKMPKLIYEVMQFTCAQWLRCEGLSRCMKIRYDSKSCTHSFHSSSSSQLYLVQFSLLTVYNSGLNAGTSKRFFMDVWLCSLLWIWSGESTDKFLQGVVHSAVNLFKSLNLNPLENWGGEWFLMVYIIWVCLLFHDNSTAGCCTVLLRSCGVSGQSIRAECQKSARKEKVIWTRSQSYF